MSVIDFPKDKNPSVPSDAVNQYLHAGDRVAFAQSGGMVIGLIEKITFRASMRKTPTSSWRTFEVPAAQAQYYTLSIRALRAPYPRRYLAFDRSTREYTKPRVVTFRNMDSVVKIPSDVVIDVNVK